MKKFLVFLGVLEVLVLGEANIAFSETASTTGSIDGCVYTSILKEKFYLFGTSAPQIQVEFYLSIPSTVTVLGKKIINELKLLADEKASDFFGFIAFPIGRWGVTSDEGCIYINEYAYEEDEEFVRVEFYYGTQEQALAKNLANTQRDFVRAAMLLETFYKRVQSHAANAVKYCIYAKDFVKAKELLEEYFSLSIKIHNDVYKDNIVMNQENFIKEGNRTHEGFYYGICLLELEGKRTSLLKNNYRTEDYSYYFCPEEKKEEDRLFFKYYQGGKK